VARNRERRAHEFLTAASHIVIDDGFEALTMARLARELDTAVGSVYRYYPSKDHLLAAVQGRAVERLSASFDRSVPALVARLAADVEAEIAPTVPLAVLGRWACSAAVVLPEEIRLLQMVSARRSSALGPGGGEALVPVVMDFVGRVVQVIAEATAVGVLEPAPAVSRAILWLTGLGGVLQADDLESYLPDLLGHQRLARQYTVDLAVGWGADRHALETLDRHLDQVAAEGPLAR
jgi:AcrR family transcriptional regulator